MTPRRQRMLLIGIVVIGVATSAALALRAFRENVLFFFSPSEIVAGDVPVERGFRLGGMVVDGSIEREPGSLTVAFVVTDFANSIPVTAAGSETVLEFVKKTYKGITIEEEQSFASANSQIYTGGPLGLSRDRGLIMYNQGDDTRDPSFVLSQVIEMPSPPRQNGLSETMFFHARAGGCKVPDARGIRFIEGL